MWQHSDDFSGQWLILKNHKHLCLFILYKDHFRCQMLKNEWQDVWGSAVTLNLLLCFSSLCLDEETYGAHHIYCITESIHRCYLTSLWMRLMVFSSLLGLKYLSKDRERDLQHSLWMPLCSTLSCMPWRICCGVSLVGVLCVRSSDSNPYQTCSNTTPSGFQSSTTIHSMATGIQTRVTHITTYWGSVRYQSWLYPSLQYRQ